MSLSPRDALATVVAALSVLVYVGNSQDVWYLGSTRWAIGTMALVGIAGCAIGSRTEGRPTATTALLSTLGAGALVVAVVGLITGSHALLLALLVVQLALWIGATVRHLHATRTPPHAAPS